MTAGKQPYREWHTSLGSGKIKNMTKDCFIIDAGSFVLDKPDGMVYHGYKNWEKTG